MRPLLVVVAVAANDTFVAAFDIVVMGLLCIEVGEFVVVQNIVVMMYTVLDMGRKLMYIVVAAVLFLVYRVVLAVGEVVVAIIVVVFAVVQTGVAVGVRIDVAVVTVVVIIAVVVIAVAELGLFRKAAVLDRVVAGVLGTDIGVGVAHTQTWGLVVAFVALVDPVVTALFVGEFWSVVELLVFV